MPHPWVGLYPKGVDPQPQLRSESLVDAWTARVAADPDGVAVRYFDGTLTAREMDEESDALAVGLRTGGCVG